MKEKVSAAQPHLSLETDFPFARLAALILLSCNLGLLHPNHISAFVDFRQSFLFEFKLSSIHLLKGGALLDVASQSDCC